VAGISPFYSGLRIFLLALSLDRGCRLEMGMCNRKVALEGLTSPHAVERLFLSSGVFLYSAKESIQRIGDL
jgi:hypothetical protein